MFLRRSERTLFGEVAAESGLARSNSGAGDAVLEAKVVDHGDAAANDVAGTHIPVIENVACGVVEVEVVHDGALVPLVLAFVLGHGIRPVGTGVHDTSTPPYRVGNAARMLVEGLVHLPIFAPPPIKQIILEMVAPAK